MSPLTFKHGNTVTVHGFLGKRRDKSATLSFFDLHLNQKDRDTIQIVSSWKEEGSAEQASHIYLKSVPTYSPVCITGTLKKKKTAAPTDNTTPADNAAPAENYELKLEMLHPLNTFPKDIIVSKDAVWPLKSRHLQMRFDPLLHERLEMRQTIAELFALQLKRAEFLEVETPILFKSTPEGAREFLVPTRREGFAYALPQSPQQYKQILMAGRVAQYYQFAKCFRDEDHRADRQPEFTQLDLEMAFADGTVVMRRVEQLMRSLTQLLHHHFVPTMINGIRHPRPLWDGSFHADSPRYNQIDNSILKIPYEKAMLRHGTDKPDLRIKSPQVSFIREFDYFPPEFKSMLTSLKGPVVEACKFRFEGSPQDSAKFVKDFFDALQNTPHRLGSESTPGVLFFDSSKPMLGLSSLGHEAATKIAEYKNPQWSKCEDGDVIIIHARKRQPYQGGSTELGRIRKLMYDAAVGKGLLPKDYSFNFLWVTRFPMFTPNGDDQGQGGSAGFSATHHPFTAPLTPHDVDLLRTDPLRAVADHYDLVLNGVEVGGGSRRIHVAEVQEYVMRDVLKMTDEGVNQFSHLLEALRAGCPPHAGFAIGFDRLIALICDVNSVRDVIAFPKNNKGEDQLVGSPSETTWAQKKTYHLFSEPPSEVASG
ncbi:tRNA synthetases class II-domain-containing protein [Hypoxylon argillaceum]|nr:tRNA synthetases class II-domain-containing protein [Hypoxylon argillaceum]